VRAEGVSAVTDKTLAAYLRPCPTCGAVATEKCRRVKSGHTEHLDGYVHDARRVPTKAEEQAAKQAAYTARYRAKKARRRPKP
jgi:hypothetical protein